jgi:hypothetical protein
MYGQSGNFDPKDYIRQKALHIIMENGGTKLTLETLAELEHAGLRLVPPKDTWTFNKQNNRRFFFCLRIFLFYFYF